MLRDKLCFGNWKLNKNTDDAKSFLSEFLKVTPKESIEHFCVFPPDLLSGVFAAQEAIFWGGQNVYSKTEGAFTGESSAKTLKSLGAKYCLVGHSERRSLFWESDELLNEKAKTVLEEDLVPVFCIGESDEERESGETFKILEEQIKIGLKDVDLSKVILAYEPVWAIGTGKAATPKIVFEVHKWLREFTKEKKLPLLYGGSVKPQNAKELYAIEDVNGFLIGGASLTPKSFIQIFSEMGQ